MTTYIISSLYIAALVIANSLIAAFGPWVSIINAFVLIGFDLAIRDYLHTKFKPFEMLGLIVVSGVVTYFLNPASGIIAVASAAAFTGASLTDWAVFSKASGTWFKKSNLSNTAGAAVDSLLFPTIAFGSLMPTIVLGQFLSKTFGGFIWSYILNGTTLSRTTANAR